MIYRRDMILGFVLLAVLLGGIFLTLLTLLTATKGGIHVSKKSVAVIEIAGPIINPMPVVEKLKRYSKNDNFPAIVIRLNTPGGGVSATQEIYETIKKVRLSGKKVVASMGAVAASGGYYIAAACDSIVATPSTITGSIGVIANFADFSKLFDKIGIGLNVRKSGKFKDMGSFSRKMTEEEKELIDNVIMDTHEQFIQAISECRNLEPDFVREYADGRIFTGRQGQNIGFVDFLGTYQDAIDMAGNMVGLGDDPPVYKETKGIFWEMMSEGILQRLKGGLENKFPRFSYMWKFE